MQELAWVSLGTPPMTVREYLVDHYAACMYRRMRVHGVESGLASALALKARKRLRSGEGGDVPALGVKDERRKLTAGCIYCSGPADSIDHLIPRLLNGPDSADNLVPACKSCNSSKGARDLFEWAERKRFFPLAATRRYLALAWRWCVRAGVLDATLEELRVLRPPFQTNGLPWHLAKLATARPRSALYPHLRLNKLASAVYTSRHDDPEPDFADPACT